MELAIILVVICKYQVLEYKEDATINDKKSGLTTYYTS